MNEQLRNLALLSQGLTRQPMFAEGLAGTQQAIEHLGYVQIDTLSVVERAHHHVLWSRVPNYDPSHLNQLVSNKQIFEHWFHAASYLPMRDYRFALPMMNSVRNGENRYHNNTDPHSMNEILARVRGEGPLRLRALDKGKKGKGSWWSWGPGKRAVERLFMQGDLMVASRKGMEKTYDLAERCLPKGIDTTVPNIHEYAKYLFDTTLRAHGVFSLKQLVHLKTGKSIREAMQTVLNERISEGIVTVVDGDKTAPLYVDSLALEQVASFKAGVKILSPFDNALIHRERLRKLFEFDFKIECYVPVEKRKFGYFCLPILQNNKFVGRIDCKVHRAEQRLQVLSLHMEEVPLNNSSFVPELHKALQEFTKFNDCAMLDTSAIDAPHFCLDKLSP